jgi:hypothetical protein
MNKATVMRYAIGSNLCDDSTYWFTASGGRGMYYVIDLLTAAPHETDPKKGWFRKKKTVQAAVDKLNAADKGGPYAAMSNGYVRLRTDQTVLEDALAGLLAQSHAAWNARHDAAENARYYEHIHNIEETLMGGRQ